MKNKLILLIFTLLICGCSITIVDEKEDRDKSIEECKDRGGTPYVENYDDSRYRPIVHCIFDKENNNE